MQPERYLPLDRSRACHHRRHGKAPAQLWSRRSNDAGQSLGVHGSRFGREHRIHDGCLQYGSWNPCARRLLGSRASFPLRAPRWKLIMILARSSLPSKASPSRPCSFSTLPSSPALVFTPSALSVRPLPSPDRPQQLTRLSSRRPLLRRSHCAQRTVPVHRRTSSRRSRSRPRFQSRANAIAPHGNAHNVHLGARQRVRRFVSLSSLPCDSLTGLRRCCRLLWLHPLRHAEDLEALEDGRGRRDAARPHSRERVAHPRRDQPLCADRTGHDAPAEEEVERERGGGVGRSRNTSIMSCTRTSFLSSTA